MQSLNAAEKGEGVVVVGSPHRDLRVVKLKGTVQARVGSVDLALCSHGGCGGSCVHAVDRLAHERTVEESKGTGAKSEQKLLAQIWLKFICTYKPAICLAVGSKWLFEPTAKHICFTRALMSERGVDAGGEGARAAFEARLSVPNIS